jgi:hypothetical protein
MKTITALLILALLTSGCVVTETRTITTDKSGTVIETTTTTQRTDPAALRLAGDATSAYYGRAAAVLEEK